MCIVAQSARDKMYWSVKRRLRYAPANLPHIVPGLRSYLALRFHPRSSSSIRVCCMRSCSVISKLSERYSARSRTHIPWWWLLGSAMAGCMRGWVTTITDDGWIARARIYQKSIDFCVGFCYWFLLSVCSHRASSIICILVTWMVLIFYLWTK